MHRACPPQRAVEADGDSTVVDEVDKRVDMAAGSPLQQSEPASTGDRPKSSSDTDEIPFEELEPVLEAAAVAGDGVPRERTFDVSEANTAPHRLQRTALPLPAPAPASTGPVATHPRPPGNGNGGGARPRDGARPTLAGSRKTRSQQQQPPLKRPNPPLGREARRKLIDENEQATAVALDPLAALQVPLIGGRYRIVERIGAGGMGKVFKVTHSQLGKTFALKIISDALASDDKMRDLFYREARMASSLSHPNIASVVDFGEDDKLGTFMVMEFLHGEPLSKILHRESRLSVRHAAEIVRQVAEALDYIHSKGIVHCDIKTENILMAEIPDAKRQKPQVKLLDFGLARSTAAVRSTSLLAGTPHYVAPERISGGQPSPSTDIYGLGILFYELLTGQVPWDGTVAQILHGHLELEPTPPSQLIPDGLDPAMDMLVLHALAKNPADRHADVAAFIYELQTVMDMLGHGRRQRNNRRADQRDDLARGLFDASRMPMALINRAGVILVANPAFAQFIMGVAVDVEGMSVQATPLIQAWVGLIADLGRACDGTNARRIIHVDIDGGQTRRLLMWLDPGLSDDQAIFGVHPLEH